jgi:YggT family protein
MNVLMYSVHLCFLTYTILLFVRIVGSWFPSLARHSFMHFVGRMTDPYLGLFRRLIPPIGGVLDLSPLLAFFLLQIAEQFILFLLR